MTAVSVAATHCKKAVKFAISLIRRDFNSSKCKTMTKMTVARIKLLRNKREALVRQMRRDIALLLQSRQDATARIRVEHVIREQNILAANEILVLFCDLIVSRLTIITKQRECPPDLKEGIASLIFAAPRSSDIPELLAIRDIFQKKYGKEFVSAATDLRPDAGVNRLLIEKLSVRTPSGEVKLRVMKEIAKEYQIDWDTTESEAELLKPPEERIEGPRTFVSASSLPVKPIQRRFSEPPKATPRELHSKEMDTGRYENSASAAQAAAISAKKAMEAADAAAYLANKDHHQLPKGYTQSNTMNSQSTGRSYYEGDENEFKSQSMGRSHYVSNEDEDEFRSQSIGRSHYANKDHRQLPKGYTQSNTMNNQSTGRSHYVNDENEFKSQSMGRSHYVSDEDEDEFRSQSNGRSHYANKDHRQLSKGYTQSDTGRSHYANKDHCHSKGYTQSDTGRSHYVSNGDEHEFRSRSIGRSHYVNNEDEQEFRSQGIGRSHYVRDEDEITIKMDDARKFNRRHRDNVTSAHSGIKFDESDCDEEIDMEEPDDKNGFIPPPNRPAPQVPGSQANVGPRVHPKLPDYDALTARFDALKFPKARK